MKKQLAFMLARQQYFDVLGEDEEGDDDDAMEEEEDEEDTPVMDILTNTRLSEYFHVLGTDLDVLEAKTPKDIYKTHLGMFFFFFFSFFSIVVFKLCPC